MGIRSRIRGPVGASADARYLHRALITDDTHSPSRMWRGVTAQVPAPQRDGYAPTVRDCPPLLRRVKSIPRPRTACTFMVVVFGSAVVAPAPGSANNSIELPRQLTSPAASAAPRPALPAVCLFLLESNDAQDRGSALRASGSSRAGGGVPGETRTQSGKGQCASVVPTSRVHQGAESKGSALVERRMP